MEMKKSFLLAGAASVALAMFAGCAVLEDAAKKGQNALAYSSAQNHAIRLKNFDQAYNEYKSECDAYRKNNPGQIAEDALLPYMPYLNRAAALASTFHHDYDEYKDGGPIFNRNIEQIIKERIKEYIKDKRWDYALEEARERIEKINNSIVGNNQVITLFKHRLSVINEAVANKNHMIDPQEDKWRSRKADIEKRLQRYESANKEFEKRKGEWQAEIDEINKGKKADDDAKAAAQANLEKNKNNPDFIYPNKKICNSSVTLYRDFKSGMNRQIVLNKPVKPELKLHNWYAFSAKFYGGLDSDKLEGIKGTVQYIFAGVPKKGSAEVLVGVYLVPEDRTLFESLVQKYKKEMPNAVVTKKTIERNKRNYQNLFVRTELEHSIQLKQKNKIVRICRYEFKTTWSKAFLKYSKERQDYNLRKHYKSEAPTIDYNNALNEYNYKYSFGEYYNCPNAEITVDIFDEMQLKTYDAIAKKYQNIQKNEAEKARQKQLNF